MKKIPTLFCRKFIDKHVAETTDQVTPGLEWVLTTPGVTPTIKYDGTCVAVINGEHYKRYDAKHGKTPPPGAIPCQPEADPVTGHWPHWLKVDPSKPEDQYIVEAFYNYHEGNFIEDGTYEAIGPKISANPYNLSEHTLLKHGATIATLHSMSFEGIKRWLEEHNEEGLVFWYKNEPICKIKRKDFGLKWEGYDD